MKVKLIDSSPKTVNNVLTVLRSILSWAHDRGILKKPPAKAGWIKAPKPRPSYYTPDEYQRLVSAAIKLDHHSAVLVMFGGDAGLRPGEVHGLHWSSLDLRRKVMHVEKAEWEGQIITPKGNDIRTVPLTDRLVKTLSDIPGRRRGLVLTREDGSMLTARAHRCWLTRIQRFAGVEQHGPHALRHTFCSILAERGAPVTSIQAMAGHKDLQTTQRYMHSRAAGLQAIIGLIEQPEVTP